MTTSITDERSARILLAAASEPGDRTTGALVRRLGAVATLDLVQSEQVVVHEVDKAEFELWRRRVGPRIERDGGARIVEATERMSLHLLTPVDEEWPRELNQLGDLAPLTLWAKGDVSHLTRRASSRVAIVGARAATSYGEHIASELASDLAGAGRLVVSGGAYGIDGAAHRAATMSRPGATIAVVAAGVDRAYPAGHSDLFTRIVDGGGLIVSELPPGATPTRWRFMERNRLIASLAAATVVVEAGYRSGALDIAARAIELGRPVGAVPGPVTSAASAGCHRLLNEGSAELVTSADDIVGMVDRSRPSLTGLAHPSTVTRPNPGIAL
ncbi:DNA-processing protein DprA [Microbacterium sp. C7(2022)]|uniref:DNA-processing protein DprA n=1 Tax=Microbacterium sp. C7(2022) TaxID=2992759 RepID=UPI00237B7B01|nr:DNA-processing protein DprA [Microbacterium sp. C7(2022)]MDE0545945.1 DNA-processing protein DprA [Microbacterium sp. C7(2022)]